MFEKQSVHSDHGFPSFGKDLNIILRVLVEENVFVPTDARQHSFSLKWRLLDKVNKKNLIQKVKTI